MNDKNHIYIPLENVNLANSNKFSVEKKETSSPLGNKTESVKYFLNAPDYNFDLDGRGLLIKYNPNKLMNIPLGVQVMEYKQLNESFEYIADMLNESGLDTDIKKHGLLTRYDNSYDLRTNENYKSYMPLVQTLAPIKRIRQSKTRTIENTWYSGNKTDLITIYDKTKESNLDFNLMRFEARHKLRDKKRIPISRISETTYYQLRYKDKQFIKDTIFTRNPQVLSSEYLPLIADLIDTDLSMNQITQAVFVVVVKNECNKTQLSLDKLFSVARSNDSTYQRNRRIENKLNETMLLVNSRQRDLYYELSYKFSEVA